MATLLYLVLDPADGSDALGQRRPPAAAARGGRPAAALPRRRPLGAARRDAVPELRGGPARSSSRAGPWCCIPTGWWSGPGEHIDEGMARLASAVREAHGPTRRTLCDHLLRTLVPDGRSPGRRGAARAAQHADGGPLQRRVPDRSPRPSPSMRSLLRRWLRHAESSDQEIAEITTACGEAATNAIEHAGRVRRYAVRGARPAGGPRGGHHGARLRRLAQPARGRPGPRPVADRGPHGRGRGHAHARGHDGAHAARAQRERDLG